MQLILNNQRIEVSPESREQLQAMLALEGSIEIDLTELSSVPLLLMRQLIPTLQRRGNTRFLQSDGSRLVDPLQAIDETCDPAAAIPQIITLGVVYHVAGEREQAIRDCLRRVGVRSPSGLSASCAGEQRAIDSIGRPPVPLSTHIGTTEPASDHIIPPGWEYNGSSTRRLAGAVRPKGPESLEGLPYVRSVRINADTRLQMLELAWLHRGRVIVEVVPRAMCLTEKYAENLINLGFLLAQPTISLFVEYVDAYLKANYPSEVRIVERFGWQDTTRCDSFVYGREVLGNQSPAIRLDDRDAAVAELADGLAPSGEPSEAYAVLRELASFPIAAFVAAAALSSILLAKLGVPGFVVDVHGETSTGKTTLLKVVASLFGAPARLLQAWNVTTVFAERSAGIRRHLPLFFDDSRQAEAAAISNIIYELCNGRGKGRGNKTGIDVSATWQLVTISTGEQSLSSFAEKGGINARVIGIDRLLFEPRGPEMKARLDNLIDRAERHCGHVARQFVTAVIASDEAALRSRLEALDREYTEQLATAGNIGVRQARYIAAIRLAGEIAGRMLNIPALNDPVSAVLPDLIAQGHEADRPREALLALHTYAHQHSDCFLHYPVQAEIKKPPRGYWMPDGRLTIYPPDFEAIMGELGFPPKEIQSAWKRREWTRCEGNRNKDNVSINGSTHRMIVVLPSAFTAVRAEEPPDDEGRRHGS